MSILTKDFKEKCSMISPIENNMKISVIIPIYNAEEYMNKCISSVVNQSYGNLEIILIDDGSTDNSSEICDRWKKIDSRISVLHKKNEGPGVARNIGIEMARGEYITFVDSDDWVESLMYENMLKAAMKHKCDIVGCPSSIDLENGNHKKNLADVSEGYLNKTQCIINFLEGNKNAWGSVHNKLYKKGLWDDIRFPKVKHLEEYFVSAKLFNKANAIWFCAYPYYHHVCHSSSLSMSAWNPGRLTIPNTADEIIAYIRDNNSDPLVLRATYRFRFLMYVDTLWSAYKGKASNYKEIRQSLRSRSMESLYRYISHASKRKGDVKKVIQLFLTLIF